MIKSKGKQIGCVAKVENFKPFFRSRNDEFSKSALTLDDSDGTLDKLHICIPGNGLKQTLKPQGATDEILL